MKTSKTNFLTVLQKVAYTLAILCLAQASFAQRSFSVEIIGEGKPLLLIPGLNCPGEVWEETVSHYKNDYECHVFSLAGFGGHSAVDGDTFLPVVRDEILQYVKANKLEKASVMGHSLGGFLALWMGAQEPDLFSAIVVVDAFPFLPATQMPGATVETAKPMAENMRNMMGSYSPEQVRAMQPGVLASMIADSARIAQVTEWSVLSDPKTSAQAMYELFTTDLREDISRLEIPVLVLGVWIAYKDYGVTKASAEMMYKNQYQKLANAQVYMFDSARHFIMYDDFTGFIAQTAPFLANSY